MNKETKTIQDIFDSYREQMKASGLDEYDLQLRSERGLFMDQAEDEDILNWEQLEESHREVEKFNDDLFLCKRAIDEVKKTDPR